MTTKINIEVTNEPASGRYHAKITNGNVECGVHSARTDTPSIDLATDTDVHRSIHANFIHKVLKTAESLLPKAP
jgi:hypothetical protein